MQRAPAPAAPSVEAAPDAHGLPRVTRRLSESVVQRALQRIEGTRPAPVVAAAVELVQREEQESAEPAAASVVDLDALAREIYPLIRRMLRIERERERRP